MAAIRLDTGVRTYAFEDIDGNVLGTIRFNPGDLGMAGRWAKTQEDLQGYLQTFEEGADVEKLIELDAKIKAGLDYVFSAPISAVLFAGGSSLSVCADGTLALENALEAIAPLLEEAQQAAVAASNARIAKHTAKYEGASESPVEG